MKKIVKIAFVCAFAAIAGYNVYSSQKVSPLSELVLSNINALASGEVSTPTSCPGGLVLCAWIQGPFGSVTYYEE